jgi:hypothetical protein
MIVKKKRSGIVVAEEVPAQPIAKQPEVETNVVYKPFEHEFVCIAESFEANYKGFHSLIEGKVSASKLVDQLEEIGKDLAIKLNETFPNEETRKEMVEFTKSTFSTIGEKIQETFPMDREPDITTPEQEYDVLKIGICSGILSGIASYTPIVTSNEK